MSADSMSALIDRIESDQDFRETLAGASSLTARWEIVKGAGFNIDHADVDALRAKVGEERDISDDELDKIAGGWVVTAEGVSVGTAGAAVAAALAACTVGCI